MTTVETVLGRLAINRHHCDSGKPSKGDPVLFMHGIFLDGTLWERLPLANCGHPLYFLDMPAHGKSSNVGRDWSLADCVIALREVLDSLGLDRCQLVGHSWGAMVALRAAVKWPGRFAGLCLFNMPHRRIRAASRLTFQLQKSLLRFPNFYAKQAAKSLYSSSFLSAHPRYSIDMRQRLVKRPPIELSRAIDAVLLGAEDAGGHLASLSVPALAVVGKSDYVGIPPDIETITVPGGHISPHEAPIESSAAIQRMLKFSERD